uniref:Uncharacterized mitochondrial protein AtMg00810-like n=1 Tax=Tanacetum cinerariifolium TaxID=118510 RepID=A0A6L2P547_TANCI|nr:uncharacterized mitochondrial protein AtMg00810-like [Tanacetum cinerariifolium]
MVYVRLPATQHSDQLVLCIVDSGCLKHMTSNLSLLRNFIEKFIGTVRFGNDHFALVTGYGDYVQEFEGDDLLTCSRESNLYTISISELAASSPLGIIHHTSTAQTPQQNGVFEPRNRTLVEVARTVLIFLKTAESLWAEAIVTACFTQNRSIYTLVSDNSAANTLANVNTSSSLSIVIEEDKAPQIVSSSTEQVVSEPNTPVLNENADKLVQEDVAEFDRNVFYYPHQTLVFEEAGSSSTYQDPSNMYEFHQTHHFTDNQTKNHPIKQVIGDPSKPVMTRCQLHTDAEDSGLEIIAYSDADHAGCNKNCKTTSGGIQFLGDKLVSWSSKKQDCITMSTAKAEYVSLSACCAQVIWMRTQLLDYEFRYNKIPMYCDSKSAISISCNLGRNTNLLIFLQKLFQKKSLSIWFTGRAEANGVAEGCWASPNWPNLFHMAQQIIPTAQLVPKLQGIRRCNNYVMLQSIPFSPKCKISRKILLDHPLSYALTANVDVPAVYLQQFLAHGSQMETLDNPFVAPVTIEIIESFMNRVGYQGVVDKRSAFCTKFLAQPWQTMFKLIIADVMEKYPSIPQRHEEDSHSIKYDTLLGKKRKHRAGETSSSRKPLKVTIRQKKQSTPLIPPLGDDLERDEVAEATILSLTLHKISLAAEAQENIVKVQKKLDEEIQKMVEGDECRS